MQTVARTRFTTIKTEGAILPADLLQRIADGKELDGLTPEAYHLAANERLNEAINRAWNRCLGAWLSFDEQRRRLPATDSGTTLTRERWLLILFQELGYGRLQLARGLQVDGTHYPISHLWGHTPIHLISFRQEDLDRRGEITGTVRRSPHSLVQEFLNRSEDHLWGMVSNGLRLRLLRDNVSLTRAAYVEFDLEAMMQGEVYSDFALLWLLCHQSRVEAERPADCWLERWSKAAAEQGTRALDALRDGVQEAISAFGRGFLAHPANRSLRERLKSGDLSTQDYYRQLLRLVYRLIFLFVAEDRDLLLLPDAPEEARRRHTEFYSVRRLREMAEVLRGSPHADRYHGLRLLFSLLPHGYPPLGLPALGGFLFSPRATPDLDEAELSNHALLTGIRALAFTIEGRVRRPVDYRNLGSEELGSVYESLLELHPQLNVDAATFELAGAAGSERKSTGSYYTPASLITCLLDSALEPVVEDRLKSATAHAARSTPQASPPPSALEAAILNIKVVDPACGSGHFLVAAAHRLAQHLARVRTGDDEPGPGALRAALRDVVRHCIHGVDVNEMAVELCKVALWMETLDPGKPLSFLEHNIQCGNSLIGVGPGMDITEVPDEAFRPIGEDDRATATALRRRNRRERGEDSGGHGQLGLRWEVTVIESLEDLARWRAEQLARLDALPEEEVAQVRAKAEAYAAYLRSAEYARGRMEHDLWTAAFFWPIPAGDAETMLAPTQQELIRIRDPRNPAPPDAELARRVRTLAERHAFFHWELAFAGVFDRHEGGFDVVLGNPPWEHTELKEKEWFAVQRPEIAAAPNAAARRRMIAALAKEDPALYAAFLEDRRAADAESHFARNSARFPLCGRGRINTYQLFAETSRALQGDTGRVGIIVPSGIATDDTTKYFFQDLIDRRSLVSLFDFENAAPIFPGVHRSYKFCLLTLTGAGRPATQGAEFAFFAHTIADLDDPERRFTLSAEEIALLNPNTRTCPIFRSKRDAELTKAIYRRVPVLILEHYDDFDQKFDATNPWGITLFTMLHSSGAAHLFLDENSLSQGAVQESNTWRLVVRHYLPLYEGKMFHQFDHRFASVRMTDNPARPAQPIESDLRQHADPERRPWPRAWVDEAEITHHCPSGVVESWFLGYKPCLTW